MALFFRPATLVSENQRKVGKLYSIWEAWLEIHWVLMVDYGKVDAQYEPKESVDKRENFTTISCYNCSSYEQLRLSRRVID